MPDLITTRVLMLIVMILMGQVVRRILAKVFIRIQALITNLQGGNLLVLQTEEFNQPKLVVTVRMAVVTMNIRNPLI